MAHEVEEEETEEEESKREESVEGEDEVVVEAVPVTVAGAVVVREEPVDTEDSDGCDGRSSCPCEC